MRAPVVSATGLLLALVSLTCLLIGSQSEAQIVQQDVERLKSALPSKKFGSNDGGELSLEGRQLPPIDESLQAHTSNPEAKEALASIEKLSEIQRQQQRQEMIGKNSDDQETRATTTATSTSTSTPMTPTTTNKTIMKPPRSQRNRMRQRSKKVSNQTSECNYEKGVWQDCQSNGIQKRILRLESNGKGENRFDSNGTKCEPFKVMRRECKIGCKYLRGEWSPTCINGLRTRVDLLIGDERGDFADNRKGSRARRLKGGCPKRRRVTKDCRRACHYIKSAWGECENGFKTRLLTLEELPPGSSINDKEQSLNLVYWPTNRANCAPSKLIRRECKITTASTSSNETTSSTLLTSSFIPKQPRAELPQQRNATSSRIRGANYNKLDRKRKPGTKQSSSKMPGSKIPEQSESTTSTKPEPQNIS